MNQGETATFFCNASGIGDLAIGCKGVDTGGGGGGFGGLSPPQIFRLNTHYIWGYMLLRDIDSKLRSVPTFKGRKQHNLGNQL